ncbi:YgaP family membrane protein [Sulfuricurvum sp.]|uniref:YgaP family membrane protein n=1 Tax=Sulfuricurvum sp. TaxID=2025608 RepID=UPI003BB7511F
MKCNAGKVDRALRIIAGVALITWAVISGNIFGYAGIILVITGAVGFCPFYSLLGINTGCKIEND